MGSKRNKGLGRGGGDFRDSYLLFNFQYKGEYITKCTHHHYKCTEEPIKRRHAQLVYISISELGQPFRS